MDGVILVCLCYKPLRGFCKETKGAYIQSQGYSNDIGEFHSNSKAASRMTRLRIPHSSLLLIDSHTSYLAASTIHPIMADDDAPPEGVQTGLPQDPSDFDADLRVSWSKLDNKFILETDEGNEFEWDTALKRWIPVVGYKSQT